MQVGPRLGKDFGRDLVSILVGELTASDFHLAHGPTVVNKPDNLLGVVVHEDGRAA